MAKAPKKRRPVRIVRPHEEDEADSGQAKVEMVRTESGLLVPGDSVEKPCMHSEVAERYAKRVVSNRDVYHCAECDEKVQLRVLQFGAKTEEEWKEIEEVIQARARLAQQQGSMGPIPHDGSGQIGTHDSTV